MLHTIETINSAVNNFIWGIPAMVCIIGVGLYLSIRTHFLQIQQIPLCHPHYHRQNVSQKNASEGAITPFRGVYSAGGNSRNW